MEAKKRLGIVLCLSLAVVCIIAPKQLFAQTSKPSQKPSNTEVKKATTLPTKVKQLPKQVVDKAKTKKAHDKIKSDVLLQKRFQPTTTTYHIFFNNKKIGISTRKEFIHDRKYKIVNTMTCEVPYLYFWKKPLKTTTSLVYDSPKGKLLRYKFVHKLGSRAKTIWGKSDTNCFTDKKTRKKYDCVTSLLQIGKKKSKSKSFPLHAFNATNFDPFIRLGKQEGKETTRKLLILSKRLIISQYVSHKKAGERKVFGRSQQLYTVTLRAGKKKSTVLVTKNGRLVEAKLGKKMKIVYHSFKRNG